MLSIVLPAYNEEKNLGPALDEILAFLKKNGLTGEIIVVNDGSRDQTGEILKVYQAKVGVIAVTHPKNLGYGAALRSGFARAAGDLIFFTDSDRQFEIKDLLPFLIAIKTADFVIGYRQNRQDFWNRKVYAEIFRLAALIFFGIKVKDVDCAFKLFKREALVGLPLVSTGALISLEILAKAKKRGYRFIELPVTHLPRTSGKPTGGSAKVVFKAMRQFLSLWLNVWLNQMSKSSTG